MKNPRNLFLTASVLFTMLPAKAQTGILPFNPQKEKTYISTRYFGPNAFPVPDIFSDTVDKIEIEVMGLGAVGNLCEDHDLTAGFDARVRLPLWTDRACLSLWGQFAEWYKDTPQTRAARRVSPLEPLEGGQAGDFYFSLDLRLFEKSFFGESLKSRAIARLSCKTASGGQYTRARFYDTPGYFFDLTSSNDYRISDAIEMTAALSGGFLCWQVDNGRQNDAVMYGVLLGISTASMSFQSEFGGYTGWKNEGDCPQTIKLRARFLTDRSLAPFVEYHHGIRDWPFDQLKLGLRWAL